MTSTRLTPLEPQSTGWRPDWPLRIWLLPLTSAVATAVVATTTTTTSSSWKIHVSAATWCLLVSTGVLATGVVYAFSESRWPWRPLLAALIGALALGATGIGSVVVVLIFVR